MRLNDLYNGIVLTEFPLENLKEDLIRPRDLQWFRDFNGEVVDFRMKTNERLYWIRWKGEWNIETRKNLKKLMLRWHYHKMRRLETKDWTRLPFPIDYMKPIYVDGPV